MRYSKDIWEIGGALSIYGENVGEIPLAYRNFEN